ncbi:hypothetical protein L198_01839 [Cryptococcus wingfieldii CBS 7118]|uniref:Uncharacterized protein n=1 Tax=Cryptococcus wingfieldii CBS 7118 TaxID=1295528 RepID=A0A1E3JWB3_9TREE|nr:hypothetical protein L198_01839 [Cryptococcus wingfieldii CBS 7118]ODO05151.1 hypothetical protein L198_01839 [Cryptococcus wingfieldii CBS 7118]
MFRQATTPALRATASASKQQARSFVSKAQFIGRLGAAPEKGTTAAGKEYLRYTIAVSKPPRRDAEGSEYQVILDEAGCECPATKHPPSRLFPSTNAKFADPARESSWFTLFNFREGPAGGSLENLAAGSLLYVEANIDTVSNTNADGTPNKQYLFRETSHRVLSKPRSE